MKVEMQLSALKEKFDISEGMVSRNSLEYYDAEDNWEGLLRNSEMPEGVWFRVRFDIVGDKILHIDTFLANYQSMLNTVKKVDVLLSYLKRNPGAVLEIGFYSGKTNIGWAKERLYEDLGLHVDYGILDKSIVDSTQLKYSWITEHIGSAVFCDLKLTNSKFDNSYISWIILPNNRLLLFDTNFIIFQDRVFSPGGDLEIKEDPYIVFDYQGNRIKKLRTSKNFN